MPYKNREKQLSAQRQSYQQNKSKFAERQRRRRKEIAKYIFELKESLECSECGENHPAVLDFHHSNPLEKEITVSDAIKSKWSKQRIDEEVAKCIVLCSNCHRKLHWSER